MRKVVIGQLGSDHIAISVHRRSYPKSSDYWDGNWVDSEISIDIRPWSGTYHASLRAEEFAGFRKQLELLQEGSAQEAKFLPLEPWISLRLASDDLGHLLVRGEAGPEGVGRIFLQVRLVFELRDWLDQSFLPLIIGQLKAIENEFPVVGSTGSSTRRQRSQ